MMQVPDAKNLATFCPQNRIYVHIRSDSSRCKLFFMLGNAQKVIIVSASQQPVSEINIRRPKSKVRHHFSSVPSQMPYIRADAK